jgi:hypothetical protein
MTNPTNAGKPCAHLMNKNHPSFNTYHETRLNIMTVIVARSQLDV